MSSITAVAVVATVVGLYGCGRALAVLGLRFGHRGSEAKVTVLAWKHVLSVVPFAGVVVARREVPAGAIEVVPSPAGVAVNVLLTALVAVVGFSARQRGLAPLLREWEWDGYGPGIIRARLRRRRLVLVVGLVAIATSLELSLLGIYPTPLLILPAVVAVAILWVILERGVGDATERRVPTDTERDRIHRCHDGAPDHVVVFDDGDGDAATEPAAFNRGSLPELWIHEDLLAEADDEDLGVAIAQAAAFGRRCGHQLPSLWTLALVPGLLYAVVSVGYGYRPTGLLAIGLLLVGAALYPVGQWLARRSTYRADREASECFGADAVREAHERIGDRITAHAYDDVENALRYVRPTPQPDLERRLERLPASDGPPPERAEPANV